MKYMFIIIKFIRIYHGIKQEPSPGYGRLDHDCRYVDDA